MWWPQKIGSMVKFDHKIDAIVIKVVYFVFTVHVYILFLLCMCIFCFYCACDKENMEI